ncbi:MAG: hypothetical protein H8E17_09690 [Deltaproteobacteria bacterium]|nr:hypothetical protein [Deltaproteobacteria bacterium]
MISEKQLAANRKNAQKSTGPKTPEGKAIASQNATTHGLRSSRVLIASENIAEYNTHRTALLKDLAPVGPMETILADRIVKLTWQLDRSARLQACTFDTLINSKDNQELEKVELNPLDYLSVDLLNDLGISEEEYAKLLDEKGYEGMREYIDDLIRRRQLEHLFLQSRTDRTLGEVIYADFSQSRALERLSMYERRIENSLYKTHFELQRLQLIRLRLQAIEQEEVA